MFRVVRVLHIRVCAVRLDFLRLTFLQRNLKPVFQSFMLEGKTCRAVTFPETITSVNLHASD